ncbi:MAG: hypothetical protein QOJ85_1455 [Solirubrobacteraceae bacterium]|nr:hypothetical protein [Solirubrobacteraceae bacterium]
MATRASCEEDRRFPPRLLEPWVHEYSTTRPEFMSCTLKRSPELSDSQALGDVNPVMERNGVTMDVVGAVQPRAQVMTDRC